MQHFTIPTCYFPSTALFLDDSHHFLLNLFLQLDEGVAYRIFNAPRNALDYIQSKCFEPELSSQQGFFEYNEARNCPLINHTINTDLAAIHAEVYNPDRFSEISVVIVDFAMPGTPGMNGLDFCRHIENNNIKKILLTDQANEAMAVAAFNEGLIHRYIKKSDSNAAEQVVSSIYELQHHYFQAMSNMVARILSVTSPGCLKDKNFAYFFRKLQEEKGIVEYYLIDNSGSFLMLDDDANVSFLIVKREADIQLHYEFALNNGASEDILNKLIVGEKIPGFWQAKATMPPIKDWCNCLVDAHRFISDETYYYAHIPGNALFDVRQQKILSYHHYLEALDAEALLIY